jgi:hypothetical protein
MSGSLTEPNACRHQLNEALTLSLLNQCRSTFLTEYEAFPESPALHTAGLFYWNGRVDFGLIARRRPQAVVTPTPA